MTTMEDSTREKRKEEISKALAFIQSPLAYPDPNSYQDFLTRLVCNLLEEGNAFFRDKQWEEAVREFTEGLNVSRYAEAEEIQIPEALLESLYVNRASACHSMGKYDQGIEDCNSALEVCKESRRALYRKALCLKELGKYKEAYDCTSVCLLSNPQDKQVNELSQELATQLGMKIRKPYISSKLSHNNLGNGVNPLSVVASVSFPGVPEPPFPSTPPPSSAVPHRLEDSEVMGDDLDSLLDSFPPEPPFPSTPPPSSAVPHRLEDSEVMGDDLDSLLDSFPPEQGLTEAAFSDSSRPLIHSAPPVLPAPTPQLPPAFFSSTLSQLDSLDSFSTGNNGPTSPTLNMLDDLYTSGNGADTLNVTQNSSILDNLDGLDSLDSLDDILDNTPSAAAAAAEIIQPKPDVNSGGASLDLLDEIDMTEAVSDVNGGSGDVVKVDTKATKQLDSLDCLDSFSTVEDVGATLAAVSVRGLGLDTLSDFSTNGFSESHVAAAPVTKSPKNHFKVADSHVSGAVANSLSDTHEFLQACSLCYPRKGVGVYSYVHKPDLVHSCKLDILLCRRKEASEWTRVRPIPTNASFFGPFVLCRELIKSGDLGVCKYGERCTFAYNQLEIDVWTAERKGKLDRNFLFEKSEAKPDPRSSIIQLLQENKGMFIYLCQKCYDSKPRIISKRFVDNQTICSNLDVRHNFDANKCLAFVVRTHNINYRKVRPLSALCHLDLCRHAIQYGCQLEDSCQFAHSVIELKTWRVQQHTGISHDEIVKVSMKYHDQEQTFKMEKEKRLSAGGSGSKSKGGGGGGGAGKNLNMKMKFACAHCWRDGLISEPDKALKYCNAKARHAWTKDRRVLLVKSSERSKWVQVRPLPHAKNYPLYYDMCAQILEKRKCNYTGKCTFAHSQEEKEMWMYMKNNNLREMQQVYDMWLTLAAQNRQADGAAISQPNSEEKFIMMPTDYAEPMSGFHCRLCGKHSNSERQWQQHISTEKHKDRVFSCEGEEEDLLWNHRFPGTRFKICPKVEGGCPDGMSCDYAHSPEELQEWTERRNFLRQKLAKAREDMLIMPDEFDFGKYNFLLQD